MAIAATPRPASTVAVLRPADEGFEVLLLRRQPAMAVMGGAHVFPGGAVDASDAAPDPALRHRLAAVRELREEAGITLGVDDLTPFAHWLTPDSEPRRFDTWFFVTAMPSGQSAVHDGTEHCDSLWVDPAAAIEMALRGDIALPPPTWMTLQQLATFSSVADVIRWAAGVDVIAIQPQTSMRNGVKVTTVPGRPERRFALERGRWMPVP